ncbi:MAG TPA: LytTR family DNA-binding domain-containing protein [Pyrinomonadaceae bacterium]|nr:LytTR family DNA-binding domain-containing protein [Pyrinomonadaceae bacterium]
MANLRVFIADDERPARAYLRSLLTGFELVEIVGEADNGRDAFEMIRTIKPDLALLDLQMPELSGLEVVRMLPKSSMPLIAFITAYDQFAIQAFELNAVDYLLKPVERSRLQVTLERAAARLESAEQRSLENERLRDTVRTYDELGRTGLLERIPVKKRDEIYLIPVGEIVSVVADGELLRITTMENQRFDINFRLKDLEQRLDPAKFVRLSRGSLVNLDAVSHISSMPGGTFLISMKDGQELSSSRQQSKILRNRLLRL